MLVLHPHPRTRSDDPQYTHRRKCIPVTTQERGSRKSDSAQVRELTWLRRLPTEPTCFALPSVSPRLMLVRCVGHCRGAPSSHHARPDEMPRQEGNDFSQRLPTNDPTASFDTTLRPTLKGPSLARTKFSKNDENLLLPVRNLCTRRLLGGREGNVPHSDCYLLSSDVPFDHNLDQT